MDYNDLIKLVLVLSCIVLPALGVTLHLVLRPLIDAILRLKQEGLLPTRNPAGLEQDMTFLGLEVQRLREELALMQREASPLASIVAPGRPTPLPPPRETADEAPLGD